LHERNRTEGLVLFNVHFCVNPALALLFSLRKLLLALLNCALSVSKKESICYDCTDDGTHI